MPLLVNANMLSSMRLFNIRYVSFFITLDERPSIFIRGTTPYSRQSGCYVRTMTARVQLKKEISGRDSQGAWRQDELRLRCLSQLSFEMPACQDMSVEVVRTEGDGNRIWLRRNGKKRIRLWKKTLYALQWRWDCYKFVARVRLVKTENISMCVTVNCKVCRSSIALYFL
jgi:hypothetical protein